MKKILGVLALACWFSASTQSSVGQTMPDGFTAIGGLVTLAFAAHKCGDRNEQWTEDLLADLQTGIATLDQSDFPDGETPAQRAQIDSYFLKQAAIGADASAEACTNVITEQLLDAGDQAVSHYRNGG